MLDYQLVLSHLATFLAGLAAAYTWLRHMIGYVHPFEAQVKSDVAGILQSIQELKTRLPQPAPVTAPQGPIIVKPEPSTTASFTSTLPSEK